MRSKFLRAVLLFGLALQCSGAPGSARVPAAVPAGPVYEFAGFMESDGERLFSLTREEAKQKRTSRWLRLKQKFEDVVLQRYDSATETLWVTRNGTELPLKLKAGSLALGFGNSLQGKATITFAGKTQKIDLRARLDEAIDIPLAENERGKTSLALYATRVDATTLKVQISTVFSNKEEITGGSPAPTVIVREGQPFAIRSGEFEFRFDP